MPKDGHMSELFNDKYSLLGKPQAHGF